MLHFRERSLEVPSSRKIFITRSKGHPQHACMYVSKVLNFNDLSNNGNYGHHTFNNELSGCGLGCGLAGDHTWIPMEMKSVRCTTVNSSGTVILTRSTFTMPDSTTERFVRTISSQLETVRWKEGGLWQGMKQICTLSPSSSLVQFMWPQSGGGELWHERYPSRLEFRAAATWGIMSQTLMRGRWWVWLVASASGCAPSDGIGCFGCATFISCFGSDETL